MFLATEPGHDFTKSAVQRIYRWAPDTRVLKPEDEGKRDKRPDFQSFVNQMYMAKRAKKFPYRSIVIDIVDNLYTMCLNHVCERKGIAYPPENDFGKTWKEVREEWERGLRALLDFCGVTFITHCTSDKVEVVSTTGIRKEIDRRVPTFRSNKAAQFLDGVVNVMGFVYKGPGGEYLITFQGDPALATGDRTKVFEALGPMKLDYKLVNDAYVNKAKEMGFKIKSKWK